MTATLLSWYTDHAIAIFVVCILAALAGEKILRWAQRRDLEGRSTMTSMASGAAFLVAKTVVGKIFFIGLALWVYENHRLFTLDVTNPFVWIGVFAVRDLVYYIVHRTEHRVNILWASHLVHHSPETIGMSTAIRIPWMEALYKPWFGLWLPLIGFNPLAAVAMDVFAATMAQLQHTEAFKAKRNTLIGKVFVTPSAHRVHHGYNPQYIDKNFGAVLIIWDRLFRTYEPEVEPVKFGVGPDDALSTPADALRGGYPRLFGTMRRSDSPIAAARVALDRPGALNRPRARDIKCGGHLAPHEGRTPTWPFRVLTPRRQLCRCRPTRSVPS